MSNAHHYAIILAGGAGKRLWPLSRQKNPKQLLPFGKKQQSLLEITIQRAKTAVPEHNIIILTTQNQLSLIKKKIGNQIKTILAEPCSRNTAPAILLACKLVYQKDPQAIICSLPADHHIEPLKEFSQALKNMYTFTQQYEIIALMGAQPTHPTSSYGYIEFNKKNTLHPFYHVDKFHEKPHKRFAATYCKKTHMLWNMGIFCAKASFFIQEYQKYAPTIHDIISEYLHTKEKTLYTALPNISIDYAIMEKSTHTYVLPTSFFWSDVGNLATFLSFSPAPHCIDVISIDAHNNIIHVPNKIVGIIGMKDICIVETNDALLIVKQREIEKIKQLLQKIEKKNKKYL